MSKQADNMEEILLTTGRSAGHVLAHAMDHAMGHAMGHASDLSMGHAMGHTMDHGHHLHSYNLHQLSEMNEDR